MKSPRKRVFLIWRKYRSLLTAAALFFCASVAQAVGYWEVGPVIGWTANPSNLLYTATIGTSSLANLADGKLEVFGNNGNVANNAVVSWTLSDPSTVYAVNVFTKYPDAGRDGLNVAKLEVKRSGLDEWVDLGADEVEYATLHLDGGNIAHDGHRGSFYAIYKDADNAPLATDVVAFRVTFGPNQDNSKTGYGEIELVGYSDVGWQLSVTQPASLLGSVAISPSSPDGFYADGTVVTLTLDKTNDVEFIKWTGDVPEADIATTPLTLTIDRSRKVSLVLKAPYFVVDGSYITDGWQKYSMTLSGSEISVTGCSSLGSNSVMDASLPVKGGYSIVSISGFLSSGVKKLILPETIKRLGNRAFAACSSLTSVSPMFPDSLTTFGGGCFANAGGFTGNVRIGFGTDSGGNPLPITFGIHDTTSAGVQRGLQFQSQALGPDILLGPGVTSIPSYTFRNCSIVTNLVLGVNMATIAASAFENFGQKAASVVFEGAMPAMANTAFTIVSDGQASRVRFCIQHSSGWQSFLSDASKVTPWDSLTLEQRAPYLENFPKRNDTFIPYGIMAADSDGLPAGSWICVRKPSGLLIFVR
jgi:hypothetical protein